MLEDRIITVRQPWATAIIRAGKDVENRSWPTSYRGRLWIHAGRIRDPVEIEGLDDEQLSRDAGHVLGHVTLIDVIRDSPSAWARPGQWHWILSDARPVRAFPRRGAIGLQRMTQTWETHGLTVPAISD